MKKLLFFSFFIALSLIIIVKANSSFHKKNLLFSNIEALAQTEADVCKWKTEELSDKSWVAFCAKSGVGYECSCGDEKHYPAETTTTTEQTETTESTQPTQPTESTTR